jgi:hypothetical protein
LIWENLTYSAASSNPVFVERIRDQKQNDQHPNQQIVAIPEGLE